MEGSLIHLKMKVCPVWHQELNLEILRQILVRFLGQPRPLFALHRACPLPAHSVRGRRAG